MYTEKESLSTMQIAYPTLIKLYSTQFKKDTRMYKRKISEILTELLLQNVIPRLDLKYDTLIIFSLQIMKQLITILQGQSIIHLQRIIYCLGEYIVKTPFLTLYKPLIISVLDVLQTLIHECAPERIIAHKYDILTILIIIYEKCSREGIMDDDKGVATVTPKETVDIEVTSKIRQMIFALELPANERIELLKGRDIEALFTDN